MPSSMHDRLSADIASRWRLVMYPRLRNIPAVDWDTALAIARNSELDLLERIGILCALVATTVILQPVGADWNAGVARYFAQLALAVPLLFCMAGPFLLRRTRRGLHAECQRMEKRALHAS